MKQSKNSSCACPNPDCPLSGQSGKGNIICHSFFITTHGRHKEAVRSYDKAIELNPQEWWYYVWKGDSLFVLNRLKEALATYRKANSLYSLEAA